MTALGAILSAFVLVIAWAWFVAQARGDRRVRVSRTERELRRHAQALHEMQVALGTALLPAVRRAADAFAEFGRSMREANERAARSGAS